MWRVLTLLARAGHLGAATQHRANASEGAYADGRTVDVRADTHPADGRHDVPIQPWHAQRRVENVLQGMSFFPRLFSHLILTLPPPALGILGTLIHTRQLPWGNVHAWVWCIGAVSFVCSSLSVISFSLSCHFSIYRAQVFFLFFGRAAFFVIRVFLFLF
jgi:hypothetical protein